MIRGRSLCLRKDVKRSKGMNKRKVKLSRTPGFRSVPYSPNRLQNNKHVEDVNKKAPIKTTDALVIPDGVELKAVKCKGGVIENKFNKQIYATPPPMRDQRENLEPLQIEPISNSPRRLTEDMMTSPKPATKARVIKMATITNRTALPKRCLLRQEPVDCVPFSPVPHRARSRLRLTEQDDKDVFKLKKEVQSLKRENRSLRSLLTELRQKNVTPYEDDVDGKRIRKVSFSDEISKMNSDYYSCKSTTPTIDKEKTTSDIWEFQKILEKRLKQANEMVTTCLGKVNEAERKASKVPQLEMEIIVLRRQLAEKRSGRLNSRDSTISGDCILQSNADNSNRSNSSDSPSNFVDSFEKENVFLESPITHSLQRASLALTSSEEISYNSPPSSIECTGNRKSIKRRSRFDSRVSSASSKSDDDVRDFTTSTSRDTLSSYASVDTETYERLLKQHDETMSLVKDLEYKFFSQQSEMETLHTEIKSVSTKTDKITRPTSHNDTEKLIKRLHKCKVSHQTLGKLLYFTLDKQYKQGKSEGLDFSAIFSNVVKNSGIPGIDSFTSV